jgi:hypothetical protein
MRGGCSCSGCGETACYRIFHPPETTQLGLNFATHAAGSECLDCHGRGPVPLSCSTSPAIAHFAISPDREVAGAHPGFVWDRLHPALAACSRGVSERIIWSVWWGLAGAISQRGPLSNVYTASSPSGVSIHENADSAHA